MLGTVCMAMETKERTPRLVRTIQLWLQTAHARAISRTETKQCQHTFTLKKLYDLTLYSNQTYDPHGINEMYDAQALSWVETSAYDVCPLNKANRLKNKRRQWGMI